MQQKNNRKKIILISAVAAVVVIAAVIIAVMMLRNSPARRLQRQLDLGNRYLSELQYDDAIAAFEAALDIDPVSVEAYLGLIGAYEGTGDAARVSDVLSRAREAGLSAEELQRIEHAAQGALERLAAAAQSGDKLPSENAETENEPLPLPEEYRTIVQALRDLRDMEFLGIPLSAWTREDMDAYIAANGLEETDFVTSAGSSGQYEALLYRPPGAPYADGYLFYAVYQYPHRWEIAYMHNILHEDGGSTQDSIAAVSLEFNRNVIGAGFNAGEGGVERFGPLCAWETFFEEHDGQAFFQYISGGGGELLLEDGGALRCYLSGTGIENGFYVDLYDDAGKLTIWCRRRPDGMQCWNITIGDWDENVPSYLH